MLTRCPKEFAAFFIVETRRLDGLAISSSTPNDAGSAASTASVEDDLGAMFDLVLTRLDAAIAAL